MNHIIINNITRFQRKALNPPEGYRFDAIIGAWVSKDDHQPLINADGPIRPPQGTKKNDIETGEDLKGQ